MRSPAKVDAKLAEAEASGAYDAIFVAYGDCGTGGALDEVCAAHGVERLPGDHCYGFFAGVDAFAAMHEDNPFTFYLTDFLCRHFDRLVVQGLKLDTHPELLPMYFGNYRRLVYLSQTDDPALVERHAPRRRTWAWRSSIGRAGTATCSRRWRRSWEAAQWLS